jgi:hypothetical protein
MSALLTLIIVFKKQIESIFNYLTSELNTLVVLIKKPIEIIKSIGIYDIFTLLLDNILTIVLQTFAINKELLTLLPYIIIVIFILAFCTLFIFPILGVIFCCSSLIKSFIYLLLSCDDDNDFRLLLVNLFIY